MQPLIETLKNFKGKLALRLTHGRNDPDESLDDWGFNGPILYFDWIHFTYNSSINIGYGSEETGPMQGDSDELYFHNDMIAVNSAGVIEYFGDWEIVPADEIF